MKGATALNIQRNEIDIFVCSPLNYSMSERRNGRSNAELAAAGLKECPECKFCWSTAGFNRHYKPCKLRSDNRKHAALRSQTQKTTPSNTLSVESYSQLRLEHSSNVFGAEVPQLLSSVASSSPTSSPDESSQQDPGHISDEDLIGDIGQRETESEMLGQESSE